MRTVSSFSFFTGTPRLLLGLVAAGLIVISLGMAGCKPKAQGPQTQAGFYKHTLSALAPLTPVDVEEDWGRLEISVRLLSRAEGAWPPAEAANGFYLIRNAQAGVVPAPDSAIRYAALSGGQFLTASSTRWPTTGNEVLAGIGAESTAWMSRFIAPKVGYDRDGRYLKLKSDSDSLQKIVWHQLRREKALLPGQKPENASTEQDAPYAALEQAERDLGLARAAQVRNAEREAKKRILSAASRIEMAHALQLDSPVGEMRAVWVRLDSSEERHLRKIVKNVAAAGITDVFLDTIYDGRAIFPTTSLLTPQHTKFVGSDPLADFLVAAQREQIRVHAGIRLLSLGEASDTPIPQNHPEWIAMNRQGEPFSRVERNRVFLSPFSPEVIEHLSEQVAQVADLYGVVGVHFDDIRYARLLGSNAGYDYSNAARKAFFEETKRDPMKLNEGDELWEDWLQFRADALTELMRSVSDTVRQRKPEVILSVRVGLDERVSQKNSAQDWPLWVEADLVDLMVFQNPERDIDTLTRNFRAAVDQLPPDRPWLAGLSPLVERRTYPLLNQIGRVRSFKPRGIGLMGYDDLRARHLELLGAGPYRSTAIEGGRTLLPPADLSQ